MTSKAEKEIGRAVRAVLSKCAMGSSLQREVPYSSTHSQTEMPVVQRYRRSSRVLPRLLG
jgi:hypothetical protein